MNKTLQKAKTLNTKLDRLVNKLDKSLKEYRDMIHVIKARHEREYKYEV